jgi:hypothetical protein
MTKLAPRVPRRCSGRFSTPSRGPARPVVNLADICPRTGSRDRLVGVAQPPPRLRCASVTLRGRSPRAARRAAAVRSSGEDERRDADRPGRALVRSGCGRVLRSRFESVAWVRTVDLTSMTNSARPWGEAGIDRAAFPVLAGTPLSSDPTFSRQQPGGALDDRGMPLVAQPVQRFALPVHRTASPRERRGSQQDGGRLALRGRPRWRDRRRATPTSSARRCCVQPRC